MSFNMMLTVVLLGIAVFSFIGMKITSNRIQEDPEAEQKLKDKADAYRESMMEDQDLDDILSQNKYIYEEDEDTDIE